MDFQKEYLTINQALWDERTKSHVDSEFYDLKGFMEGKNMLRSIELNLLGDIKGQKLLHLQCHFGLDTLSMARMGAQVTGVDFSGEAISRANTITAAAQLQARFIQSDIYALPEIHDELYDLVFSSYGTIGWLPDINRWAGVVAKMLRPGGRFVFVEFHPVVWMFDNDFKQVEYKYANDAPIYEELEGSYTDGSEQLRHPSVSWNHGLAEVIQALLSQGLQLQQFQEFDYSPYDCLSHLEEQAPNVFRIKHLGNKIPMVYAIAMVKPA
jgi:ubiquinone/menaquinone biosynthesis C-methylase UbiE